MAAYISFQPRDYFSPKLYTGTGAEQAITGVGFQPDMVWQKSRSATTSPSIHDAVRGATYEIYSSANDAQADYAQTCKSFDSDGFTVGTDSGWNANGATMVTWNWKMGTTTGLPSPGDLNNSNPYSFNQTAGQSVIQYTGDGSAGSTVGHGLGKKPGMIIIKRTDGAVDWQVYNEVVGATKYAILNTTATFASNSGAWANTEPNSTNFQLGTNGECNTSSGTYIAYVFAPINGFSKFGLYPGNGNADGTFVYTGFRPAFIMVKTTGTNVWLVMDNKRSPYNVMTDYLKVNNTDAENDDENVCDFLSNGFKLRSSNGKYNGLGSDYAYAAFAEFPFVSSNSKAGTAR